MSFIKKMVKMSEQVLHERLSMFDGTIECGKTETVETGILFFSCMIIGIKHHYVEVVYAVSVAAARTKTK